MTSFLLLYSFAFFGRLVLPLSSFNPHLPILRVILTPLARGAKEMASIAIFVQLILESVCGKSVSSLSSSYIIV